ncbi:hypothetical protein GCM10010274_52900 [Streptomyces lavendofoliae]|uniref:Uncharacterized protein n=1 Tax=Streptomyces lavendofoliae TaxID=67314 RepID=A0A918M6Z9_9ACTN|nr:hypothetical protein GCM10010274_52900 [Streptomyces lavendofoliae]
MVTRPAGQRFGQGAGAAGRARSHLPAARRGRDDEYRRATGPVPAPPGGPPVRRGPAGVLHEATLVLATLVRRFRRHLPAREVAPRAALPLQSSAP